MTETVHLPELMADQLCISRSEARRIIVTGGVKKMGDPITDLDVRLDGSTLVVGRRTVQVPKGDSRIGISGR